MTEPTEREIREASIPCKHLYVCDCSGMKTEVLVKAYSLEKSRREEAEKAYLHTPVGHIVENLQKELTRLKAELEEAKAEIERQKTWVQHWQSKAMDAVLSAKGGGE